MFPKGKIILVEDNSYDHDFVKLSLEQTPFTGELVWLQNGQLFLDYVNENEMHDVVFILMDLKMPILNGLEALELVKKKYQLKLPIIMFTASKHERDVQKCIELGACAYVIKPLDFDEFEQAIKNIWTFWGRLNEVTQLRLTQLSQ